MSAKQKPSVSSTVNVCIMLQLANTYNHILDMRHKLRLTKYLYFVLSFCTIEAKLYNVCHCSEGSESKHFRNVEGVAYIFICSVSLLSFNLLSLMGQKYLLTYRWYTQLHWSKAKYCPIAFVVYGALSLTVAARIAIWKGRYRSTATNTAVTERQRSYPAWGQLQLLQSIKTVSSFHFCSSGFLLCVTGRFT